MRSELHTKEKINFIYSANKPFNNDLILQTFNPAILYVVDHSDLDNLSIKKRIQKTQADGAEDTLVAIGVMDSNHMYVVQVLRDIVTSKMHLRVYERAASFWQQLETEMVLE